MVARIPPSLELSYDFSVEEPLLETDPTRMCELLVGLPDVNVDEVADWPGWVRIAITERNPRPVCAGCDGGVHAHGRNDIVLVDPPVSGRAARLVCPSSDGSARTRTVRSARGVRSTKDRAATRRDH